MFLRKLPLLPITSTCNYIVNHYVKIWHVCPVAHALAKLGDGRGMAAQTEYLKFNNLNHMETFLYFIIIKAEKFVLPKRPNKNIRICISVSVFMAHIYNLRFLQRVTTEKYSTLSWGCAVKFICPPSCWGDRS